MKKRPIGRLQTDRQQKMMNQRKCLHQLAKKLVSINTTMTLPLLTTPPCLPVKIPTKPLPSPLCPIATYPTGGTVTPGGSTPFPLTIATVLKSSTFQGMVLRLLGPHLHYFHPIITTATATITPPTTTMTSPRLNPGTMSTPTQSAAWGKWHEAKERICADDSGS